MCTFFFKILKFEFLAIFLFYFFKRGGGGGYQNAGFLIVLVQSFIHSSIPWFLCPSLRPSHWTTIHPLVCSFLHWLFHWSIPPYNCSVENIKHRERNSSVFNSLSPCAALWQHSFGSTLSQVILTVLWHDMRGISQEVIMNLIWNVCWEITLLNFLPHLPGSNELASKYQCPSTRCVYASLALCVLVWVEWCASVVSGRTIWQSGMDMAADYLCGVGELWIKLAWKQQGLTYWSLGCATVNSNAQYSN